MFKTVACIDLAQRFLKIKMDNILISLKNNELIIEWKIMASNKEETQLMQTEDLKLVKECVVGALGAKMKEEKE